MQNTNITAIEMVKTFGPTGAEFLDLSQLRSYMDAKGFDLKIIENLCHKNLFAPLFSQLVLRLNGEINSLNDYGQVLNIIKPANLTKYSGTDEQNARIDSALANSGISKGTKRHSEGAATLFQSDVRIPTSLRSVPIAIVGYGAAGILIDFALQQLGFNNITVYDKAEQLGIWSYEHVYGQSRNNPARLEFFGEVLEPAPGDGNEVRKFLKRLIRSDVVKARVEKITPGPQFKNKIHIQGKRAITYPIIINTIGLGKPKPVSNPDKMTTTTPAKAGIRWQKKLTRDDVNHKTIVMIGLGNSTAEMLRQIHQLQDLRYAVDYRVLTHYPQEAVVQPNRYITNDEGTFRVFRDISKPNLVDYQGDLAHSRYDYFRALHNDKIIPDVKSWAVKRKGSIELRDSNGNLQEIPCDLLMTLIGYQQPEEVMTALGCSYNKKQGHAIFDYDGEIAAKPGLIDPEKRLHKGCFGFGSILETPLNPNAIVIPGMLHRIGDLAFGVVMRAAEVNKKELLKDNRFTRL
jgi:hypothetical protein